MAVLPSSRMTGAQATCLALSRLLRAQRCAPPIGGNRVTIPFPQPSPITMKRFAGMEPLGGVNRNVSPSSPTNSPRLRNAERMPPRCFIRLFRRALVGVAGSFVFEQADDLQVGRLHVGSDHFDGHADAQRFRGKYIFLGRGGWVRRTRVGGQQRQHETRNEKFEYFI